MARGRATGIPRRRRRRLCAAMPAAPKPIGLPSGRTHSARGLGGSMRCARARVYARRLAPARAHIGLCAWLEQRACSSASSSLGCAASSSDCMNVIIAACAALASAEAGAARRCDGASNPTCDAKKGSRGQRSQEHSKTGVTPGGTPGVPPGMRPCTTRSIPLAAAFCCGEGGGSAQGMQLGATSRGREGGTLGGRIRLASVRRAAPATCAGLSRRGPALEP